MIRRLLTRPQRDGPGRRFRQSRPWRGRSARVPAGQPGERFYVPCPRAEQGFSIPGGIFLFHRPSTGSSP
jgi:hypothetical protein